MLKLRLLPAVAGGAAALLLLKGIQLATMEPTPPPSALVQVANPENPSNSPFTESILRMRKARLFDPETTGSTAEPPKEEASKDDQTKGEKGKGEKAKGEKKTEVPPPPSGTPVKLDEPAVSPAERGLLQKLGERREQLDERQRELETRENLLKAADKKLEDRINELKQMEQKGAGPDGQPRKETSEQQQLKNLVTMYEAMKPKDAAKVFDRLSLSVLVPVVNAMNPRKMSEILAAMTPEAAEKLTVALATGAQAQRNQAAGSGIVLPAGELQAIDPKRPPTN